MNKPTLTLKYINDGVKWRVVQTAEEAEELFAKMLLFGFKEGENNKRYFLYVHPDVDVDASGHWQMSRHKEFGVIDFHNEVFSLLVEVYDITLIGRTDDKYNS